MATEKVAGSRPFISSQTGLPFLYDRPRQGASQRVVWLAMVMSRPVKMPPTYSGNSVYHALL